MSTSQQTIEIPTAGNIITEYQTNQISKFKVESAKSVSFVKNIVILGKMGSGKTLLAKAISDIHHGAQLINATRALGKGEPTLGHSLNFFTQVEATKMETRKVSDDIEKIDGIDEIPPEDKALQKNRILDRNTIEKKIKKIWDKIMDIPYTPDLLNANGDALSDGQKNIFLLLSMILNYPENAKVIVDEPELYLHELALNTLWNELEDARKDITFIYITHNYQFALSRQQAAFIWVKKLEKSYETSKTRKVSKLIWDWEQLFANGKWDPLKLALLGNKKKILFVESTDEKKHDSLLYKILYPDFVIFPVGNCGNVIKRVRSYKLEDTYRPYILPKGLIDLDFRTEEEIKSLEVDSIYTTPVREFENIFVIPDVVSAVRDFLDCKKVESFKTSWKVNEIIVEEFENNYDSNVSKILNRRLKEHVTFNQNHNNKEAILNDVGDKFDNLREKIIREFKDIKEKNDIIGMLKYTQFNLSQKISELLGVSNYIELTLEKLEAEEDTSKAETLKDVILKYLPKIS